MPWSTHTRRRESASQHDGWPGCAPDGSDAPPGFVPASSIGVCLVCFDADAQPRARRNSACVARPFADSSNVLPGALPTSTKPPRPRTRGLGRSRCGVIVCHRPSCPTTKQTPCRKPDPNVFDDLHHTLRPTGSNDNPSLQHRACTRRPSTKTVPASTDTDVSRGGAQHALPINSWRVPGVLGMCARHTAPEMEGRPGSITSTRAPLLSICRSRSGASLRPRG